MTPWEHSLLSAHKFGGSPEDYLEIHEFIDSSKYYFPHFKHRAVFHHTTGAAFAHAFFGPVVNNTVVRDIAFEHIKEDLGFIAKLEDWYPSISFIQQVEEKTVRQISDKLKVDYDLVYNWCMVFLNGEFYNLVYDRTFKKSRNNKKIPALPSKGLFSDFNTNPFKFIRPKKWMMNASQEDIEILKTLL